MSLDVTINFKESKRANYFLDHPYIYDDLSEHDKACFSEEDHWSANITHNLVQMAQAVPVKFGTMDTTLYYACWRPEQIGAKTVADVLPMLIQGIHYMIDHRAELVKYNPENGWGTYEGFIKFLLNYKQACEDNDPECTVTTWR